MGLNRNSIMRSAPRLWVPAHRLPSAARGESVRIARIDANGIKGIAFDRRSRLAIIMTDAGRVAFGGRRERFAEFFRRLANSGIAVPPTPDWV